MKKQSFKLFTYALVLGLFMVLGTAVSAKAQQILQFDVPFEFHVGKEKFAAGKYEIKHLNSSTYLLRNAEGNQVLFQASSAVAFNKEADFENLVFNRYGETYFLRKIYTKRLTDGRGLNESKLERELRRQTESENKLAEKNSDTEEVSIRVTK